MRQLWRLLAFLGRYGHQPVTLLMGLTFEELHYLSEGVGELLDDEREAMKGPGDA